jgi:hypothetical protein
LGVCVFLGVELILRLKTHNTPQITPSPIVAHSAFYRYPLKMARDLFEARAKLVLPFYLYEGEHFDNGSWFEPCTRGLRGEKVHED